MTASKRAPLYSPSNGGPQVIGFCSENRTTEPFGRTKGLRPRRPQKKEPSNQVCECNGDFSPTTRVPCCVGFPTTAYHIAESSRFERKLNNLWCRRVSCECGAGGILTSN